MNFAMILNSFENLSASSQTIFAIEAIAFLFFIYKIVQEIFKNSTPKKNNEIKRPAYQPNLQELPLETPVASIPVSRLVAANPIHQIDMLSDVSSNTNDESTVPIATFYKLLSSEQKARCQSWSLEFTNINEFLDVIESKITWIGEKNTRTLVIANLSGNRLPFATYLINQECSLQSTTEKEIFWGVDITSSAEFKALQPNISIEILKNKVADILSNYDRLIIVDRAGHFPSIADSLGFVQTPVSAHPTALTKPTVNLASSVLN